MVPLQKETLSKGFAGMSFLRKNLPLISALIIWLTAGATGYQLLSGPIPADGQESGSSIYLLGPARALLSENLYERADVYYHKGAPHKKEVAFVGFFQKWKQAICPIEVQHAKDTEILEIMPWLRLATAADPKNIEAYLVASYWLSHECKKPELAIDVLAEAAAKNPLRYEIQMETGRMHLYLNEMEAAARTLDKALVLLEQQPVTDPEQAVIDQSLLLTLRSYLFEFHGNANGAITAARLNAKLNPERKSLNDRLEQLQNESLNPERAKEQIAIIFQQTKKTMECNHDEHVHDENCTHEEPSEHVHGLDCNHEEPADHVHGPDCDHDEPEVHVHGPDCNHD
jgi:tetratricopeptide (TPR) repeat protein